MPNLKYLLFLLPCPLLGILVAPTLAASINVNPGDDIGGKISSAQSGDTVYLGSGTFNVGSTIIVPSGVTVTGVSPSSTHIIFNLAGTDSSFYGLSVAGNASNVTIEQLDMVSNHGVIQMSLGDPYTDSFNNVVITDNNFQYGGGQFSDGTYVFGIFGSMPNHGLQITHNYFHDSTGLATRNWCIWDASNSNLDYNVFYNIEDGGQISAPGQNVSFSHNYGTHIHRMGQEAGLAAGSSLTFNGNVFYDWVNPYPDSDALSIVGPCGEVDYTNNFFQASIAPGSSWGTPDGGGLNRFGLAIEGTGEPANVTGNTFVGTWACCYSSTMQNANVSNNTVYGGALWGNFDGEPGPYGYGSVNATNNTVSSESSAPNPPANTFAGPQNDLNSSSNTASSDPAPSNSTSTDNTASNSSSSNTAPSAPAPTDPAPSNPTATKSATTNTAPTKTASTASGSTSSNASTSTASPETKTETKAELKKAAAKKAALKKAAAKKAASKADVLKEDDLRTTL